MKRIFFAAVLLAEFFGPLSSSLTQAFDIEGRVSVAPPYPKPVELQIPAKDASDCGPAKVSPRLRISPGGFVANCVVKLEGAFPQAKARSSDQRLTIDQTGCEFLPHVILIPQNTTLSILNSDSFLHNVRAFDQSAQMLFNDAMPRKGQVLNKRFPTAGRFILRCGLHHWMHAMVVVREHPFYALTDASGYFRIEGIPDGTYRVSVWHEVLDEVSEEVGPASGVLTIKYPPLTP